MKDVWTPGVDEIPHPKSPCNVAQLWMVEYLRQILNFNPWPITLGMGISNQANLMVSFGKPLHPTTGVRAVRIRDDAQLQRITRRSFAMRTTRGIY